MLRASGPVALTIEAAGLAHELSIHWADMNVETRIPMPILAPMRVGNIVTLFQHDAPMLKVGEPPAQRLPPVTVYAVQVAIPVGQLGASSVFA